MNADWISMALFAFVIFRIGNRAYMAWQNGFDTWPIMAGIAGVYTILALVRLFVPMPTEIYMGFWVLSLICIFASQALYNKGARDSVSNSNQGNYPPGY